jgi:hypothetical protein
VSPVPESTVKSKTDPLIIHFPLFSIACAKKQGHQLVSFRRSA